MTSRVKITPTCGEGGGSKCGGRKIRVLQQLAMSSQWKRRNVHMWLGDPCRVGATLASSHC